jgi:hypothetical protein
MGLLADEETDPRLAGLAADQAAPREPEPVVESAPAPPVVAAVEVESEPDPDARPVEDPAPAVAMDGPADRPAQPSVTPGGLVRRGERNADPVPPPPAAGFGGLAVTPQSEPSLFTVVAQNAREGMSPTGDTTKAGLTRRVRGAQRPDAATAPRHLPKPEGNAAPTRSRAEDVYSFLSSFQSGVERGRAVDHNELEPTEGDE